MITLHVTLTILITYRFLKRFYINKIDGLATKCGLFKSENCVPIFYMAFFLFKIGVTDLAIRYLRIAAFLPVRYMQTLLPPSLPQAPVVYTSSPTTAGSPLETLINLEVLKSVRGLSPPADHQPTDTKQLL